MKLLDNRGEFNLVDLATVANNPTHLRVTVHYIDEPEPRSFIIDDPEDLKEIHEHESRLPPEVSGYVPRLARAVLLWSADTDTVYQETH